MSGFLKTVFKSAAAAPGPLKIAEAPTAISYTLASFRWHMDTRTPVKAIAIHDFLGSCASWQQLLHEPLADFPLLRHTPSDPLEVFCADLRGHNFSENAPMTSANAFPLACAADVVKMQADILRCEAPLFGIGLGALVASCAALHAPEAFSSLTLFVKDLAELHECKPASYALADVVRHAPREAKSLADLNAYLQEKIPSATERATLLSTVEVRNGSCRFRFNKELLEQKETFVLQAPAERNFTKPTTICLYGEGGSSARAAEAAVRARFPAANILQLDTKGKVAPLDAVPVVPLLLQSCNLLGQINEGAAE
ncbi:putative mitochondrial hypothetical protein [Leptomonas pyrrhocoris]|uniref:AB hydrolase-1 domain-containing protein n=1 Tax=Leptomonas pyrrhocoris TaxID=157538 RepID=A0A0M9G5G2_LEPPY|nr:putative mitochondrial hypothetical protein [Leptomonas pyrrhocoris]KPA82546.1 putative mitochondrial hypothetical protein [Leptomonas pyrrhocoris]|eukprot:XP_015660985.1 putative mitochondrial hypothetical protein [Leptomonas pyrrhocoris]